MTNIDSKYLIHTFPNGLRAVTARTSGMVCYAGIVVNAGSRDEPDTQQGLAHFVEHTIFKGTSRRSSWHISNRMETVGGELNAYTTKEETVIYANAPAGYSERALELIADLVKNASFPGKEIEKEREVIIEEIHSYQDSPSDSVFDEFEELIYAGSDLAHNILGIPESVRRLTPADARSFIENHYTAGNLVVYCCGPENPDRLMKKIARYFSDIPAGNTTNGRAIPQLTPVFDEKRDRGNHQANTIAGVRLFGRNDPRRHALFLLNNYLGGPCMNSRLNLELRERRGLVYTVESSIALMSNAGTMMVYFGTDPADVRKCLALINREIERLAASEIPERAFSRIREQYCGQLIVGSDNMENRAMSLAKSISYYNEIHDLDYTAAMMRDVTATQVREIAGLIAERGLSSLSIC